MIQELVSDGYLKTPLIIEAFRAIDRKNFVPEELAEAAYDNTALPIGFGQTISQPLVVAFMLERLQPRPGEKILDVGAGSGWKAGLLAYCVSSRIRNKESGINGKVITIERIPALKKMAEENIGKYNFIKKGTVKVVLGDGSKGYKSEALYDKIIAGAAGEKIPESWQKQLKVGGRIVTPVGHAIAVLDKVSEKEFQEKRYEGFSFVPLIED